MRQSISDAWQKLSTLLSICVLSLGLPSSSSAQTVSVRPEAQTFELSYFTLRNKTGSAKPGEAYGGERSGLKAGNCRVGPVDLGLLSPLAEAAPSFMQEELLRVQNVQEMKPVSILARLEQAAGTRGPALYVHGYFIGFEKGCRRAALLQHNAGLEGRLLWFSWPSDGTAASYTRDEADLYWSVPDLADTIIELEQRFGAGVVDVIGHSLGARGVVLALYELATRRANIRLGHVVLLAPDMDFGIFARMVPRITLIASSVTVYAATGDKPLALSAQLHGYARLGESGNDVAEIAGVEVIDVGDRTGESPTGHLYHIYSPDVGADLKQLLNEDKRAATRSGLLAKGENLWHLQPAAWD